MKLSRRIGQVWNWLPAFRAVAESEHLPTASREAHLSASALSRSVRLLEDDLGIELFVREGRQLELTEAGRGLLAATRGAMRALEMALDRVLASETAGPVHVAAPGPYCSLFVLPAFRLLRSLHPDIVPHVVSLGGDARSKALHEGALDIVVDDEATSEPDVRVTKLCELGYGVYVGEGHPLQDRDRVEPEDLESHAFVVPPEGISDHWPPHLERRIGMVVQQLHVAVDACETFGLAAVLPDVVTRGHRLQRLPIELVPARSLYALSRKAAGEPKRTDLVLDALARIVELLALDVGDEFPPPIRSTMRPPPPVDSAAPTLRELKTG
jgi:DNA-binding transcriptional LysR family regulator